MKKVLFILLLLLIPLSRVYALNCQYTENETYQESEWGLYNLLGDYKGIPLEFKDFIGGQFNLNGCISTPSFKVHNTLEDNITINISYINYWTKPPFYSNAPTNHKATISIQQYSDSNPLTGDCPDIGSGSIWEESITYIITGPETITLENKNITKQREICKLCGFNTCLNDGDSCNPLYDNSKCGSGICNIASVCGHEKIVNCSSGLRNCNNNICLAPLIKNKGDAYMCEWECINTDRYESGMCAKSSLIISLTSWPEEGDLAYFNFPENLSSDEPTFQYNFTNSSEIDRCLLLIDNDIVATSRDFNNINDFLNWNWNEDNLNLTEGNHTWKVYCNYTSGIYSYSENRTFYAEDYTKIAPEVYLSWPNNNQIFNYEDYVSLELPDFYNTSEIKNCSNYIDNKLIWVFSFETSNWTEVNDGSTPSGKHIWSYSCTNIYGRTGYSENRTFYRLNENIIPENLYLTYGDSNDDLSNTSGLYIFSWVGSENRFQGIYFIDNINLNRTNNLSDFISISNYKIFINSVKAPWLNKNATLVFDNITFTNPRILRDGSVMDIPFLYVNSTVTFNVTGFSEYALEETPTSSGNSAGGSSGGGGGGGGGGSSIKTITNKTSNQTTIKTNNQTITFIPQTQNITGASENITGANETEQQGSGRSFITGAVIGIGNGIKNNWIIMLIIVIVIVGSLIAINSMKRREGYSSETTSTIIEKAAKVQDWVRCSSCGKMNSKWRRFCIRCSHSLRL